MANKRHIGSLSAIPVFELWLPLHFEGVESTASSNCRQIVSRLNVVADPYDKTGSGRLMQNKIAVEKAIEPARPLDASPTLIPEAVFTGVYRILGGFTESGCH